MKHVRWSLRACLLGDRTLESRSNLEGGVRTERIESHKGINPGSGVLLFCVRDKFYSSSL